MAYVSIATVRSATGMNDSSLVSDAYITTKIEFADNLIDAKIGQVYVLPLSDTPSLIESLSLELTTGFLYLDQYGEESMNKDKNGQLRIDNALKILDDIQSSKMRLYKANGTELERTSFNSPSFYPTEASSDESADDSTAPIITMDGQF